MIPVRSERICSMQSALKCARREFKLHIFTEVYCHTRVEQRKSMNECSGGLELRTAALRQHKDLFRPRALSIKK